MGLQVSAAFPLSLARDDTRIPLQRTQLTVDGLKQWQPTDRLRIGLGVAARLAFDRRSTERPGGSLTATAGATRISAAFGLLLELQWLFARGVGAYVAGGADIIASVREVLMGKGLERKAVKWEKFW